MESPPIKKIKTGLKDKNLSSGRHIYLFQVEYSNGLKMKYENARLLTESVAVYISMVSRTETTLRPDSLNAYFKTNIFPKKINPYIKQITKIKLADMYKKDLDEYISKLKEAKAEANKKPYTDDYIRKLRYAYIRDRLKNEIPHKYE